MVILFSQRAAVTLASGVLAFSHGRGVLITPAADRYEGFFLDGKKSGQGVEELTNGEKYEGFWENGLRHGTGVSSMNSGYTARGIFELGVPVGYFRVTFANGETERLRCDGTEDLQSCIDQKEGYTEGPKLAGSNPDILQPKRTGSGFHLHGTTLIVTNQHLVKQCGKVKIVIDGGWKTVNIRYQDEKK